MDVPFARRITSLWRGARTRSTERTSAWRRALLALGVVLVLLVLVPGALYRVPALAGADEALVVLSGSMEPTLKRGDLIFIDHLPAASLAVGDIVTFRAKPGSPVLVTHRVVEVVEHRGERAYRTQGDANEDADAFVVTQQMVVGRETFHIPYWGLLATTLKTKLGYFALVVIPGAALIGREFVKLYRELDAASRAKKGGST